MAFWTSWSKSSLWKDNQIEITSQNHGFAIDPNSLSKDIVK